MTEHDFKAPQADTGSDRTPGRRRVERFAAGLIKALFRIFKISKLHDVDNKALVVPLSEFTSRLEKGLEFLGPITIEFGSDLFKLNDLRLRLDEDTFNLATLLAAELKGKGVGSLYFSRPMVHEQVKILLKAFMDSPQHRDGYSELNRKLAAHGVPVKSGPLPTGTGQGGYETIDVDKRVHALILYGRMVALMKRMVANLDEKSEVKLLSRRLQRCTQGLVDLCEAEAHTVIGLAQIKDYNDYEYHHSVNVAVLSIVLGREIGLDKNELNELASCALFYDLGTFKIPNQVLYKRGRLTDEEWALIKRHPMLTVATILKVQGFSPSILKRLVVGFEHHIGYDGSGYPVSLKGWKTDLYTRIISIADAFDAMTSRRPNREPVPADLAMRNLIEQAGKMYDPALVKVFINCMGIYPAGSIVQLSDGRYALVLLPGKAPDFDKPKVKVMVDARRRPVDGEVVDLAAANREGTKLGVIRLVDPEVERLPVPRYFARFDQG